MKRRTILIAGTAAAAALFSAALPVSRARLDQRAALATLTEKALAASRQLAPPAIAATTRSRRSRDRARVIAAGLRPASSLNQKTRRAGITKAIHSRGITL